MSVAQTSDTYNSSDDFESPPQYQKKRRSTTAVGVPAPRRKVVKVKKLSKKRSTPPDDENLSDQSGTLPKGGKKCNIKIFDLIFLPISCQLITYFLFSVPCMFRCPACNANLKARRWTCPENSKKFRIDVRAPTGMMIG